MTGRAHAFAHAEATAQEWLNTIAKQLGTQDSDYTFRVLRAWLHGIRDRLTVENAAHLAAQLPELLRGVFYEGWAPSKVPAKVDIAEWIARYSREAAIAPNDVNRAASAVSAAMGEMFSPGQLTSVLALLPAHLRTLLKAQSTEATAGGRPTRPGHERPPTSVEVRLTRLETDVQALAEAVRSLALGLEQTPAAESTAQAARQAHQLLLAAGTSD